MGEREQQIRERMKAATAGPWRAYPTNSSEGGPEIASTQGLSAGGVAPVSVRPVNRWATPDPVPDARFIAHAPEDIAYLLAEVERLTKALAAEEEHFRKARDYRIETVDEFREAAGSKRGETYTDVLNKIRAMRDALTDDGEEFPNVDWPEGDALHTQGGRPMVADQEDDGTSKRPEFLLDLGWEVLWSYTQEGVLAVQGWWDEATSLRRRLSAALAENAALREEVEYLRPRLENSQKGWARALDVVGETYALADEAINQVREESLPWASIWTEHKDGEVISSWLSPLVPGQTSMTATEEGSVLRLRAVGPAADLEPVYHRLAKFGGDWDAMTAAQAEGGEE